MRCLAILLLLALVALPLSSAGSEEDPEIRDPAGDASLPASTTTGAMDALDIVAVWLEESNGTLVMAWKVVAVAAPGAADRFEYGLDFQVGTDEYHGEVWRQYGDSVREGGLWGSQDAPCAHTSGARGAQAATLSTEAQILRLEIPASCIGGTNITASQAYTFHCVMGQGNVCINESFPDGTDRGRDFVLGTSPAMEDDNATVPPLEGFDTPAPGAVTLAAALCSSLLLRRGRR